MDYTTVYFSSGWLSPAPRDCSSPLNVHHQRTHRVHRPSPSNAFPIFSQYLSMLGSVQGLPPNKQQPQLQQQAQLQQQGASDVPPPPLNGQDFTLSNVLHFLQSEWRKYERDRNEWEIERAEMRVRPFAARPSLPFIFFARPASRSSRESVGPSRT